jgi:hypothetical protein
MGRAEIVENVKGTNQIVKGRPRLWLESEQEIPSEISSDKCLGLDLFLKRGSMKPSEPGECTLYTIPGC